MEAVANEYQIGATAVGNGQIELAQTFVIGSLLCNHLLVRIMMLFEKQLGSR
jgi:hypothetical protein